MFYIFRFVNTLVEKYNLSTSPFIGYNENAWYYVNGRKVKVSEGNSNPNILGFKTSSNERGKLPSEFLSGAVEEVCFVVVLNMLKEWFNLRKEYHDMNYLLLKNSGSKINKQTNKSTKWKKHANVYRSKKTILNFKILSQTLKCVRVRACCFKLCSAGLHNIPFRDSYHFHMQRKIPCGLKKKERHFSHLGNVWYVLHNYYYNK